MCSACALPPQREGFPLSVCALPPEDLSVCEVEEESISGIFEESPESLWYRLGTQLGTTGRQLDLREVRPSRRSPRGWGLLGCLSAYFHGCCEVESLFCFTLLGC